MDRRVIYLIDDSDEEPPPPKRCRKEADYRRPNLREEIVHVDVDLTEDEIRPAVQPSRFLQRPSSTSHRVASQTRSSSPRRYDKITQSPVVEQTTERLQGATAAESLRVRPVTSDRAFEVEPRSSLPQKQNGPQHGFTAPPHSNGASPMSSLASSSNSHLPNSGRGLPRIDVGITKPKVTQLTSSEENGRYNPFPCSNCHHRGVSCQIAGSRPLICVQCLKRGEKCDYSAVSRPLFPPQSISGPSRSFEATTDRETPPGNLSQPHSDLKSTRISQDASAFTNHSILQPPHEDESISTANDHADEFNDETSIVDGSSINSPELPTTDLGIEAVMILVDELQRNQRAWRDRDVEAELRQGAIDMKTRRLPVAGRKIPDPFKALPSQAVNDSGLGDKLLHKRTQANFISAASTRFDTPGPILPRYKAIGRVNRNFLAPNRRTQKWRPYEPDDELEGVDVDQKYMELPHRYAADYPSRERQVRCQEAIKRWQPWADTLLESLGLKKSDILAFFASKPSPQDELSLYLASLSLESVNAFEREKRRLCTTCGITGSSNQGISLHEELGQEQEKPSPQTLVLAGLTAFAFHDMTGISLWHMAIGGHLLPQAHDAKSCSEESDSCLVCNRTYWPNKDGSDPCAICFCHRCPHHGTYHDPFDFDEDTRQREHDVKVIVDDEEKQYNIRHFVALPRQPPTEDKKAAHICGVFCQDAKQSIRSLIGRHPDGTISGHCQSIAGNPTSFKDHELCSDKCFWQINNRPDKEAGSIGMRTTLPRSVLALVEKMLPFFLDDKRGPCAISRIIKDVTCEEAFEHMIYRIQRWPHQDDDPALSSEGDGVTQTQDQLRKRKGPVMDVSRSMELDKRPSFSPCSHEGPCTKENGCNCASNKLHCERSCGCHEACTRRFKGCTCVARGNKVCFKDQRCECWKLNRECDPDLCRKCGVFEVLDSSNKYKEEIRIGRCRNNRIQLGIPAPTTKAPSQIQGYGLYSRAPIASGEFIGEYVGEVLTQAEGNRRGAMYHVLNQEYLFLTNREQEVDASNNGNKMRFMNNSLLDANINVEPRKALCSGVVRVGLFARRAIKAGEELLYNYSYPEEVTRTFWEPGERPANARRQIPMSSHRIARTTGTNNMADEAVSDQDGSLPPMPKKSKKRKRPLSENRSPEPDVDVDTSVEEAEDGQSVLVPEIGDSEDTDGSEYETNGFVTEDEGTDVGGEQVLGSAARQVIGRPRQPRQPMKVSSRLTGGTKVRTVKSKASGKSRVKHRRIRIGSDGTGRKRGINPGDKRLGGRAQQKAWRTRKQREALREAGLG